MAKIITNLNNLARKIIEKNQYISIASADRKGVPWISPVVYCYDVNWNIYFVSMPTSRHCSNLSTNNKVACAIFDSRQKWGEGVGLQIEANSEVLNLKESIRVSKIYALRKYPYGGINTKVATNFIKSMVLKGKQYKIYKITPTTIWMNDPNSRLDVRVKVDLNN